MQPGLLGPFPPAPGSGETAALEEASTVLVVPCPRDRVGRVIGRGGETIKALQLFSGATIQIDQSKEPTEITLLGTPGAVSLAQSMVEDIINGAFKGFAMLRQTAYMLNDPLAPPFDPPLYVPRYGFVARNQIESPRSLQPVLGPSAVSGGPFPMGLPAAVPAPLTPQKLPTGPAGPAWTPRAVPVTLSPQQALSPQQGSASNSGTIARSPPGPSAVVVSPQQQQPSPAEEAAANVPSSYPSSLTEMMAAMQLQAEAPVGSPSSSPAQPLEGKPSSEASEDWVQLRNPDGRIFYHNPLTGESRWAAE